MSIKPRVLILRAPGTNCDEETQFAFELANAECEKIHINQILEQPKRLRDFQIVCFPGGFSYGDDVAAGRILATKLESRLSDELRDFCNSEKLVLGICNGFQIMLKMGLFGTSSPQDASNDAGNSNGSVGTLTWNDHGRFEDRWVRLATDGDRCVFLRGVEGLYLPIAHSEGKFVFRDKDLQHDLAASGQLCLRYANSRFADSGDSKSAGRDTTTSHHASSGVRTSDPGSRDAGGDCNVGILDFPSNPNGSQENVAGICDPSGRIFGLMPHPERHVEPTQHPRWTREGLSDHPDGLAIFENAVSFFE